ncbi:hypothetical protein L596_024540 [Steinernema carpocapsae]|uniref:Uncharacterized protein n=1 Tax=Steinernema carpocapsae TaxID=34508 RepID=A0A4U5MH09_STECR|nr:hypothetical protein L596_024540 [Steinernema carpocapsae]
MASTPSTAAPLFPREESISRFRQALQESRRQGAEPSPLAIVAPRGAGKTSFIRMLQSDPSVIAVHFCRPRDAYTSDRCVVIQSISKQLMQTFPNLVLPAISPLTLLLGGEDVIEDYIAVPLAYLPKSGKTTCVIIDDPSPKLLSLVQKLSEVLPTWLRICVACREAPKGFQALHLGADQSELYKFAYSTLGKCVEIDKFVERVHFSWFEVAIFSNLHRLKLLPTSVLTDPEPLVTVISDTLPQRIPVYFRLVATSKRPPTTNRLLEASQLALPSIKFEDINQEVRLLEQILQVDQEGWVLREELLELAEPLNDGHAVWADYCINRGGETAQEIALIAYHMAHSPITSFPDRCEILKLLGAEDIEFRCDIFDGPTTKLLTEAGAQKIDVMPDFVHSCAIGDENLVSEHISKQRPDNLALGLIAAASRGHERICSLILEIYPESSHFVDYYQWNALRSAACNNHINILDMLVKYGINVDECGPGGRTALRAAAWSGHPAIVKRLLHEKADVNKCDVEGRSALMAAAFMDHADIVKILIEFGGNTNLVDNSGATALHLALSNNTKTTEHKSTVLNLIKGGSDVNSVDRHGRNCLHLASYHGEPMITAIIENSSNIDAQDDNGCTSLMLAACQGQLEAVQMLVSHGAGIDSIDNDGRTALMHAAIHDHLHIVDLLLSLGADEAHKDNNGAVALHYACAHSNLSLCRALCTSSTLNAMDRYGNRPLMIAVQHSHIEIVAELLDYGAEADAKSLDGESPLRIACFSGNIEMIRLVASYPNVDLDDIDLDGNPLLHTLLSNDADLSAASCLLDLGACTSSTDFHGRNAAHVMASMNDIAAAELLLKKGANFDWKDAGGRTPLMSAVWAGNVHIVHWMCKTVPISLDDVDCEGATALNIACNIGNRDIVALLLRYGADPTIHDHVGRCAVDIARLAGHDNILQLLKNPTGSADSSGFGSLPSSHSGTPPLTHSRRSGVMTNPRLMATAKKANL